MGILKDGPFTFRVLDGLFALVGFLPGFEVHRMAQVFTPAAHHIRYGGGVPSVGITLFLDIGFHPFAFVVGSRSKDFSFLQLSRNL